MIDVWKEKYGFVFKALFDGKEFYFRTLSRDDYMDIQQKITVSNGNFDNELEVVKVCLLEPKMNENELKNKAGLVSVLSERIMIRSGFQQVDEEEL